MLKDKVLSLEGDMKKIKGFKKIKGVKEVKGIDKVFGLEKEPRIDKPMKEKPSSNFDLL